MSHPSDYIRNLSLRLSRVLDDIGLDDSMVRKRRHIVLAEESLRTVSKQLQGTNVTMYNFGSRTEGATTQGLNSDTDVLVSDNRLNVIQDLIEWRECNSNLLMVRDANTQPGYCLLQQTYANEPISVVHPTTGRMLIRNDWFVARMPEGAIRHGPSLSVQGLPGFFDRDLVHAFYCKSWPREARQWLDRTSGGNWPPEELKRQAESDGCFVVPVGCHGTENEELQWRISTSLTERRLMFALNIVQIKCYVLMKMILKSHQHLNSDVALSSFICKTVLLHCIEIGGENIWQDDNLLGCLNVCLKFLYDCVLIEYCPHFIIKGNNLLANRILPEIKPQILATIQHVLISNGRALMEIEIDQLGIRLSEQFQHVNPVQVVIREVLTSFDIKQLLSGHLLYSFMQTMSACMKNLISSLTEKDTETIVLTLSQFIEKLGDIYVEGNNEQNSCEFLSPFLYMSFGSVLASQSISKNLAIPQNTFTMIEPGSNCFSSNLKRASLFYCTGNILQTLNILDHIREQYMQYNVGILQSLCCCYQSRARGGRKNKFNEVSVEGDIKHLLNHTAFCVRFLPSEVNCVPEELRHEYFRSELNFYHYREQGDDWMDWAVVDSIPFFYFLQYKVYSNQGIRERQQAACDKLRQAIESDINLGRKDTALNLLGQCLQQENRLGEALDCYNKSIRLRPAHNAANSLKSNFIYFFQ